MSRPMPELSPVGAIARRADPDRFLCALFAPPAKREAMFTLIAFNNELARAREVASNPILALIRLTWWREAVEEAAAGGTPRAHEVAGPLHGAVASGALDAQDLIAMAEAREAETEAIATPEALLAWLRGTAGGFAVAAGRLLGAGPAWLPRLQQAGTLYGFAGVLRSPAHAALLPPGVTVAEAPPVPDLHGLPAPVRAAALPLVLARRDLRRMAAGRPASRTNGDRLAVAWRGVAGF